MSEVNSIEIWKPVLNWESYYEVSSFGNVRSVERMVRSPNGFRKLKPKSISQRQHKEGYMLVTLCRDNTSLPVLVHRIVTQAFIGKIPSIRRGDTYPDDWVEPNHKDGNKTNNRVENLEIVTRAVNIRHAIDTGLMKSNGEENPCAILTNAAVHSIRLRYIKNKVGYKRIAKEFGVSVTIIRQIINKKTWKNV